MVINQVAKKSKNMIIFDNPISKVLTDNEKVEQQVKMSNFLNLITELILENQDMIETKKDKAS